MFQQIIVAFVGALLATSATAIAGIFVWRAVVSFRLDAIEGHIAKIEANTAKAVQDAAESRRQMHEKTREIERRLDRADIP